MSFRKTAAVAAVTSAATTVVGSVSLGAPYGRVHGFTARNWASSAKAAAGTDALQKVKLTDADSRVFYLDAADRDYKTAAVNIFFAQDETATGLSDLHVDATGTARAADSSTGLGAIIKSPVAVEVQNAGTATDYFEVSLFVEV
jgi:hypothetical protein